MNPLEAYARLIQQAGGETVVIRHVTITAGPNPTKNPPDVLTAPVVNGLTIIGATTIAIRATKATGQLAVGDSFMIAGNAQAYTLTNAVTAAANVFTGLTFTPALVAQAADGAAVTFTFAGDQSVLGKVGAYDIAVTTGELVKAQDQRVIVPFLAIAPTAEDLIFIAGVQHRILDVKPRRYGSATVGYELHART